MLDRQASGVGTVMITVRFFASLRERMGQEMRLLPAGPSTVREVWDLATDQAQPPTHLLAAVNLEYADFDAPIADGDEVAFFPPVTGGAA